MRGISSAGRCVAACACIWLIACGLLNAHHVASSSHAVDARGSFVHARVTQPGHGEAADPVARMCQGDGHRDGDHAACFLTYAGPAMGAPSQVRGAVLAGAPALVDPPPARAAPRPAADYRLAPKTSPPPRG